MTPTTAGGADASSGERPLDATGLPPLQLLPRLGAVRAAMAADGLDALLVTKLINVRYLSGFSGSNAIVVLTADRALFVTDGRYAEQSSAELAAAGVDGAFERRIESADVDTLVASALAGHRRVGLEAAHVSWAVQRRYADRFDGVELVPTTNLVEACRERKDPGEVARIEAAAAIADRALQDCVGLLHAAPTEREFALALEVAMRGHGADGPSFETIVASGPNGALPHARPGGRRIERGDLVVVDFGALLAGYHSDMTRTLCVGPPSAEQQLMFDVVLEAQGTARDAVRAGAVSGEVDAIARRIIGDAGWGEQFSHGTGHGIGLEVHEAPLLSRATTADLLDRAVVTVEPGVYLRGVGGVRIEDTVVVGADGCRSLTRFPKELEV